MTISMRISKYPDLPGLGLDFHTAKPPGVVVPPPTPLVAPMPAGWLVMIAMPLSSRIYGKYTIRTITEGMGDILFGHDWGILQMHIPIPPVLVSLSMGELALGSSHKYFLPCYGVQEKPHGGALALFGASATPVAVTSPVGMIIGQDCIEMAVAPTGILNQLPTTRWVGFGMCDLFAGLISMGTDAAGAAVSSKVGGRIFPVEVGDGMGRIMAGAVVGAVLGAVNAATQNAVGASADSPGSTAAAIAGLCASGVFAPAGIGLAGGKLADFVGNSAHQSSSDGS